MLYTVEVSTIISLASKVRNNELITLKIRIKIKNLYSILNVLLQKVFIWQFRIN